jgi:hypothetical protein
MLRRALAFALAVAVGVLACSLATSLDGLSETPPPALPDVFPTPSSTGTEGNTPLAPDSSSVAEAGGQDAAPGDAGPGSYCTTDHPDAAFCADYEEGDETLAYEHGILTHIAPPERCNGCLSSVDGGGRYSPGAFVVQLPVVAEGSALTDWFDSPVVVPATAVSLRFDMKILALTAAKEVDFVSLHLQAANGDDLATYVEADETQSGVLSIALLSGFEATPFALPADGQWHTYAVDLSAAPSSLATVAVDDGPAIGVVLPGSFVPTKATLFLGPAVYPPANSVRVAFDNVLLTPR